MELYHYKKYDNKGRPVVSVCLVKDGSIYSRGLAFCSPLDFGNLTCKRGLQIARARALRAHETESRRGVIRRPSTLAQISTIKNIRAIIPMDESYPYHSYKEAWNVQPTEEELEGMEEIESTRREAKSYKVTVGEQFKRAYPYLDKIDAPAYQWGL